jgi:hypothetical protein
VSGHTCAYAKALSVRVRALSRLGGVKASYVAGEGCRGGQGQPCLGGVDVESQRQRTAPAVQRLRISGTLEEGTVSSVVEVSGRQDEYTHNEQNLWGNFRNSLIGFQ